MKRLTSKQSEALEAIESFIDVNGYPPSRVELAEKLGIYPNAAQTRLDQLHHKGYIRLFPKIARGIQIVPRDLVV